MNPTFICLETQQNARKNNEDICKIFHGGGLCNPSNAKKEIRKSLENMTVIMRYLKNPGKSFYHPLSQVENKAS